MVLFWIVGWVILDNGRGHSSARLECMSVCVIITIMKKVVCIKSSDTYINCDLFLTG